MLIPRRHDRGWPRLTLLQSILVSPQSFRLLVRALGQVDNHDARGADWEVIQLLPLDEKTAGRAGR